MNQSNKRKQEEETESDIISHLPNQILASILSLIPIKESAKTSILSKSWRQVWHSIPHLKIDGIIQDGSDDIDRWLAAFYSILRAHQDPVESCYILIPFYAHCEPPFESHLDNLISLLSQKNLRSLAIVTLRRKFRIPRHVFLLQSLQELMLQNCKVVLPISFTGLPCLRILELLNVSISGDDFARLVCSCPALETLEMNENKVGENSRINAPNLVHLVLSATRTKHISLENVPLLAHACFKIFYNMSSYEASDGDTDEINSLVNLMMQLDNVETLSMEFDDIGEVLPREHMPQSLPSQHRLTRLKKLHLEIPFVDSQGVLLFLFLLRSCPILEEFSLWNGNEALCAVSSSGQKYHKGIGKLAKSVSECCTVIQSYLIL
ncbi:hypothetical protein ACLOJK_010885 [Asimina triloba]